MSRHCRDARVNWTANNAIYNIVSWPKRTSFPMTAHGMMYTMH